MANLTSPQLYLCAFCYEPTDLVRVCLTPQCQNCAINNELYPDQPQCLPECTFQHGPVYNIGPLQPQRQMQLFKLVPGLFLTKLEAKLKDIKAEVVTVSQTVALAKVYLSLGLTTSATVKERELLHDQIQFQLERFELLKNHLSQVLAICECDTPSIDGLFHLVDRVDSLLAHHQPIKVQPLLLPGQVLPDREVVKLQSFTTPGGGKLRQARSCYGLIQAALAPAVVDDVILVSLNNDDDTAVVKVFYNLNQASLVVATQGLKPQATWLPPYCNDFTAESYFTFSADGVWFYDNGVLSHRNVTTGIISTVTEIPVNCLATGSAPTQAMVMICDDLEDLGNAAKLYSAWILVGDTWSQLWSQHMHRDEIGLCSIMMTPHHVVIADLDPDQGQITLVTVEFLTGRQINLVAVKVNFEEHPVYFKLLGEPDYRLHILVEEPGQGLVYYIYNLDGSVAYHQAYFYHNVRDHFYGNFGVIVTRSGQVDDRINPVYRLKVLAYNS